MVAYRITKYNPILRGINGCVVTADWSDLYSFMKKYKGDYSSKFSEYSIVEGQYVNLLVDFLKESNIFELYIGDLIDLRKEDWAHEYLRNMNNCLFDIRKNLVFDLSVLRSLFRLMLRGLVVGELYSKSKTVKISIDEDMYVFIIIKNCSLNNAIERLTTDLYIEEYDEAKL